ncbi:MAG: DUF2958 domain-containing protein [Planctomycetes bacterium]|nr:DUF2958 domain-containing protein [Planctomycetota bacterium]
MLKIPRDPSNPAYVFIPDDVAAKLPPLYATQNDKDPIAWLKFFTPDSSWTWLLTEYDPEQRLCFGLVIGHERELGYFTLDELEEARGPIGLPIERDIWWQPTPLSKCR